MPIWKSFHLEWLVHLWPSDYANFKIKWLAETFRRGGGFIQQDSSTRNSPGMFKWKVSFDLALCLYGNSNKPWKIAQLLEHVFSDRRDIICWPGNLHTHCHRDHGVESITLWGIRRVRKLHVAPLINKIINHMQSNRILIRSIKILIERINHFRQSAHPYALIPFATTTTYNISSMRERTSKPDVGLGCSLQ